MLNGKAVALTGAGSGIGRATAMILAKAGARVFITDYDGSSADETAAMVEREGGIARAMQVDVTDENAVAAMVKATVDSFGKIDGAFNNAGLRMNYHLVQDLPVRDWDRVQDVNLKGVFMCMKHEVEAMRRTGGGAIVNTSSANGLVGAPYSSEYIASKHGVIGLTRAAACEAGITGVRVNAVLPGLILTPMTEELTTNPELEALHQAALARHPIGRIGKPEDIGYAVKWLLCDESSFVNGAAICVDGGFTAS